MEGGAVGHNFERDPPRFGLIWFSSFRGEDLNVIFYQNMPNLDNWYKSATYNPSFSVEFFYQPIYTDYAYFERKKSSAQKLEVNYLWLAHFQNYVSASCSCSLKLSSF
jgi:hypothetical protein